MSANPRAIRSLLLLVILCGVMTLCLTYYVGNETLYASEYEARRLSIHRAILTHTPPPGGWIATGADGLSIRLLVVHSADILARTTGIDVLKIYKLLDMGFIFMSLLMLYAVLSHDFEPVYPVVALLYVGSVLPLTYALHYFHPWDRPALFLWLAAMWAVAKDRYAVLVLIIVIAVAVKFDAVLLPALYFLAWVSRDRWRSVSARTALLVAGAFGVFFALCAAYPGGFAKWNAVTTVSRNLSEMVQLNVRHPTLLAFAVPVALAVAGMRDASRFARAAAAVGGGFLLILFLTMHFSELRAEMGAMVLLLPAALFGLRRIASPMRTARQEPAA